jgi:ABC-type nickel/cobalt efflux system permease component RcnA
MKLLRGLLMAVLFSVCLPAVASAHSTVYQATDTYLTASGTRLDMSIAAPSAFIVDAPDASGQHAAVEKYFQDRLKVAVHGSPCRFVLDSFTGADNFRPEVKGSYHCDAAPARPTDMTITSTVYADLMTSFDHRVTLTIGAQAWRMTFNPTHSRYPAEVQAVPVPVPQAARPAGFYSDLSAWLRTVVARLSGVGDPLPWYYWLVIAVIAAFLGSLHALTPGHGKTLMSAFLLGRGRSTVGDVATLAAGMTTAHTAVIYALGFTFLVVGSTKVIDQALPVIDRISAVIVIGLGLYLVRQGIRRLRHHHHHSHPAPEAVTSRRGLFVAGASGGLVPCIDALSLMLLAATLHAVALGLYIVLWFSLGLAAAIVLIGLTVMRAQRLPWLDRFGGRVSAWAPVVTGSLIAVLGGALLLRS